MSLPVSHSVIFIFDYGIEIFLKRLVGKTDIDDGFQRLDTLTKEEGLMTAARNLLVTNQAKTAMDELNRLSLPGAAILHVS